MEGIGFDSEKINRYFKEKLSDDDASYINEVFCDNKKEKDLKNLLSKQFDELLPDDAADIKNLDHILYRIHYDINTKLSERNMWSFDNIIKWTLRIAGVIIIPLVIFICMQIYREANLNKEAWVEINAPAWTRAQFTLPDGTTGWLNSNSSVKYDGSFRSNRKVILKGEAFFDVFKDKKRPFIVTTNEVSVTVLGTRFNIASYENDKNVEVVLEKGELIFSDRGTNKSYTMKPNDLVNYDKSLKNFSIDVVDAHKYYSWTEGKLVFRNDPLDVIAQRLSRWYNIDIEVKLSVNEDIRWRATFVDEGLETVLSLLKRSLQINYKIEAQYLKPDGTFTKRKVVIFAPATK